MNGAGKAAVFGGLFAAVIAIALVVAYAMGLIALPGQQDVSHLLVIGTAPDEQGTELAAYAFTVDTASGQVTLLDPLRPVTVPGTSARNAREALPFGGGAGVAAALEPQTGNPDIPWVLLPGATWAKVLDDAGGVRAVVPERFSSYRDGTLVLLEAGPQQIPGMDAVVLAGSVEYFESPAERATLLGGIAGSVSALVGQGDQLARLVESGAARSSLPAGQVPTLP
jgi:hypothetical protein